MSTTLTIRNLEESVKQKLRVRAASHGRSMEAEARDILTSVISNASNVAADSDRQSAPPVRSDGASKNKGKFDHVIGIWKGRLTTDEIMQMTRGE